METYKNFKVGDRVSAKQEEESYDGFGLVKPDDIGTIKAFPAKVRMTKGPLNDGLPYFAYIEFDRTVQHPICLNGKYRIRGGFDLCNIRKAAL
jgi:hypothetical protein